MNSHIVCLLRTPWVRHNGYLSRIRPISSCFSSISSSYSDRNKSHSLNKNLELANYFQERKPLQNFLSQSRLFSNSTALHSKEPEPQKEGIVKRFKMMAKNYWYVLIPVHVATSIVWFGGFYVLAKSGVDIISVLEALSIPRSYLDKLEGSDVGYYAIAYACYKVATPARYTVTVGGTTYTIVKLKERGFIKTSSQISESIQDKKDEMKEKAEDLKEKAQEIKGKAQDKVRDTKDKYKDEWVNAWEKFSKSKRK